MQVLRLPVGSVQQHIFLWQTKSLLIPIFPNKVTSAIEKIFKTGLNEQKKSKLLYSQAETLLLEELGLKDFEAKEDLSCVVNLSDVKEAGRIDAEFWQPKYERLLEKIKNYGGEKLFDVVENVAAKFDPSSKPDTAFKYVELSNINSSIGVIDGFSDVLGKEAPSRAKRILKEGDVIVSSVEGSLGKVALVHSEQDDFLASTGFFQFRAKDILPEVLLILAKSPIMQMQLEKQTAGTILTAVPKNAVENVFIPILPKPTQQKIADLVRRSHEARKRAKELLEEAKRKVEEMIEKVKD